MLLGQYFSHFKLLEAQKKQISQKTKKLELASQQFNRWPDSILYNEPNLKLTHH
jgi:hypothetical protein